MSSLRQSTVLTLRVFRWLFHGNEFSYYYYFSSICVYMYLCMNIYTEILREDLRYPLLSFSASETDSSTLNLKLIFFYFAKISGQEASVILLCPHPWPAAAGIGLYNIWSNSVVHLGAKDLNSGLAASSHTQQIFSHTEPSPQAKKCYSRTEHPKVN